jgi:phenylalanyl-tRNA synthetase beta chain
LQAFGLKAQRRAKSKSIKVTLATHRPDLTGEADLVEELARLLGYEHVPTILPPLRTAGSESNDQLGWERKIRCLLSGAGLVEVINLPFTTDKLNRLFPGLWPEASAAVAVLNPLAKENAEMRLSLLPGLIRNLQTNLAHKAESFQAFHLGKAFRSGAEGIGEERHYLAAVLYGARSRHGLRQQEAAELGFLDCKGLVENIFGLFHIDMPIDWTPMPRQFLHPGKSAGFGVAGQRLGYLGEIHPDVSEELGVPAFLLFELDFEALLKYAPRQITAHILPRFPSVERDFAVVVERDFPSQRIVSWINNLGEALIEQAKVFDQYLGAPIPEGKKSLAYKILYRAEDRTLTDAEINTLHQNLVEKVGEVFGAERRS